MSDFGKLIDLTDAISSEFQGALECGVDSIYAALAVEFNDHQDFDDQNEREVKGFLLGMFQNCVAQIYLSAGSEESAGRVIQAAIKAGYIKAQRELEGIDDEDS